MNELDEARRQLARLAMENQLVKTENRRLRKLAVNRGRGRVLSYALEDAKALLLWRFAGYLGRGIPCIRRPIAGVSN